MCQFCVSFVNEFDFEKELILRSSKSLLVVYVGLIFVVFETHKMRHVYKIHEMKVYSEFGRWYKRISCLVIDSIWMKLIANHRNKSFEFCSYDILKWNISIQFAFFLSSCSIVFEMMATDFWKIMNVSCVVHYLFLYIALKSIVCMPGPLLHHKIH